MGLIETYKNINLWRGWFTLVDLRCWRSEYKLLVFNGTK